MLFCNSLSILPGNVMFNGVAIERVPTFKFLGLHIDEHLNWKYHISKLEICVPTEYFTLYATLILPYLHYGVLASLGQLVRFSNG